MEPGRDGKHWAHPKNNSAHEPILQGDLLKVGTPQLVAGTYSIVIGKDITRFHCALWPAMLMSAGLPLPRMVFGHGFVYCKNEKTGEVQKLSKSLGNVVEPMELVQKFSSEAFRYYFMSQCPFGGDGEFSFERFTAVFNNDLANNLGNNYSRILTMCARYFNGRAEY
jgi:methionyl-tRNA synthetase